LMKLGKLIHGRIAAVQTSHPFIVTEANGRQLLFQAPRKRRLSRTYISVNQVYRCHSAVR
jgi:hypothetical protein